MFIDKKFEDTLRGKDLIYPTKEHYSIMHVYRYGNILATITTENVAKEAMRLDNHLMVLHKIDTGVGLSHDFSKIRGDFKKLGIAYEIEVDVETFNHASDEYRDTINYRIGIFKKELYEYHGVTDNPKADAVYERAYDRGHSSGFNEVSSNFGDLVDLII